MDNAQRIAEIATRIGKGIRRGNEKACWDGQNPKVCREYPVLNLRVGLRAAGGPAAVLSAMLKAAKEALASLGVQPNRVSADVWG